VVLTSTHPTASAKRFLSRTARYSGLLNILDFAEVKDDNNDQLKEVLTGADAWLSFNVSEASIETMANLAFEAGVEKVLFTLELPPNRINETTIPAFDTAVEKYKKAEKSFIGIRHGSIIEGDENNPYEIFNSSLPCLEDTIERGVLARVAAELLQIDNAENSVCGLSSAGEFSRAYLNILRSSGLTRRQEVAKLFDGGTQRVARITVDEYEAEEKRKIEKKEAREKRIAQEAEEERLAKEAEDALKNSNQATDLATTGPRKQYDGDASITPFWDEDDENEGLPSEKERIEIRTDEILRQVYSEFEARLYAKSTSRTEFFESNREMAKNLAIEEIEESKKASVETDEEKKAKRVMLDRLVDVNRKQYSKLLALERREMQNQKDISDIWVKYVFLLLEVTMKECEKTDTLFYNQDQFGQTLMLRKVANQLRADCGLPTYDVIYDPLDAEVIVKKYSGKEVDFSLPIDDLVTTLNEKYGPTLKAVPALRGAAQIVELAIETLVMELPPIPQTVTEKKGAESKSKQQAVSAGRLEKIAKRGSPSESDDSVGRM
jgi:hypothetical protein